MKPTTSLRIDAPPGSLALLVDDEAVIRDIGCEMLEALGLSCISADTGENGLRLFRENRDHIAIVILDIELPGISGKETYEELIRIDPRVRVLFASGYGREYVENRFFHRRAIKHFMSKPFQLEQLFAAVRQLLEEKSETEVQG